MSALTEHVLGAGEVARFKSAQAVYGRLADLGRGGHARHYMTSRYGEDGRPLQCRCDGQEPPYSRRRHGPGTWGGIQRGGTRRGGNGQGCLHT